MEPGGGCIEKAIVGWEVGPDEGWSKEGSASERSSQLFTLYCQHDRKIDEKKERAELVEVGETDKKTREEQHSCRCSDQRNETSKKTETKEKRKTLVAAEQP